MAGQGVPATNFIYADAKGNIGLFYNAMFPDRPAGFILRGVWPGDTSADLWTKTLPFDRGPALVNPRSGYVMNANNTPWVAAGPGDELDAGRLIGVVTVDDVVDVIDEEAEDDLFKLGGVSEDDLYRAVLDTSRSRLPWLAINMVTAVIAASAVALFESTIASVVALAVLMPVVAGMGGNAGTQALRSEEHTSELQSLMRISYAVFCLK